MLSGLRMFKVREDPVLSQCLDAMRSMKAFGMQTKCIGRLSLQELTRHFSTLQHVSLPPREYVSAAMTLELLTSCPVLTFICAPQLKDEEIIWSKSWVSSRLETFRIHILITEVNKNAIRARYHAVFGRLDSLHPLALA